MNGHERRFHPRSPARLASAAALGAIVLALLAPAPSEAQTRRAPAIRISGGHVWIGDRHAGSIGTGGDAFGLSRIIRDGLRRTGDSRASRFGPGRVTSGWPSPRQRGHPGSFRGRGLPGRFPAGGPAHRRPFRPKAGLILVLHHPLGGLVFVGRTVFVVEGGMHGSGGAAPAAGAQPDQGMDRAAPAGRAPGPAARAPAAPPPLGPDSPHCADVTIRFGAGGSYGLRVDLRDLDASSPREAEAALAARLREGRPLALRDVYGVGFNVPAGLVEEVRVEACRSALAPPR